MENTNLKPIVRFPEFTENWVTKRTGEIAPLQRGFDLPTRQVIEGNFPVVYSNGILRKHNSFKVEGPGVVTGRSGTIGKVSYVEESFWPHNTSLWVTDFKNNDPKFIYYFYSIFNLERFSGGSTVPTLNRNDVHFVKKNIPSSKNEQKKIADFLTSIETRITLLKEKKDTLLDFKKGVMQKIFNQEIRFKDDNGNDFPDWEEKNLGEVAEFRRGSFPQPYGLSKWYDDKNGFPFIQVFDVSDNMKLKPTTKRKISKEARKLSVEIPKDTLILTIQGSIGRMAITEYDACIDRTLLIFTEFNYPINKVYFMWVVFVLFQFEKKRAVGGTIKTITKEKLSKFKIKLPSLPEQTKIANYLTALDDKIDALQQKIETIVDFKKGLLQKMFV